MRQKNYKRENSATIAEPVFSSFSRCFAPIRVIESGLFLLRTASRRLLLARFAGAALSGSQRLLAG